MNQNAKLPKEVIQKTINFLRESLVDEPENIPLRVKLASAYLEVGDFDKANSQISFILKLEPNNGDAKLLQGLVKDKKPQDIEQGPDQLLNNNLSSSLKMLNEDSGELEINEWFEKPKVNFAQVGGMDELKEEIRVSIIYPFEKPDLYKKYGKKVGGGILLYGPPGCGKTHIARATAGEIQAEFLSIGIEEVLDMYIGQSEKKIHRLFEEARQLSPTVMFFDEVDALSADRLKTGFKTSLVNQFLTEMDGVESQNENLLVIGATNSPWQVDPAFRRPGRFDKVLFVPPPDKLARAEIFRIYLREKPVDNFDYLKLAEMTELFSGADIYKVCDLASEMVMREVISGKEERNIQMKDMVRAIELTNSSIKDWFATARNFAKFANESGTYTPVVEFLKKHKLD
jgi:transitional endoplasmic reticulum ATPase